METLKFLRTYFHIPERKKICWGIIEETVNGTTEHRLGICLGNSRLYLDIARRRFFTEVDDFGISRHIYKAERTSDGDSYVFKAKYKKLTVNYSKTFVADVYYFAIYSEDLENDVVY